jgi:hypothetical protein
MSLDELKNKILITSTPNSKNDYVDNYIGDLSITTLDGSLSIYDGNSFNTISNTYNWQNDLINISQIYFQDRIKDLYIFCIYKQDNIFKIGLFEMRDDNDQILKTNNLNEIVEILKSDLSDEEFREYERRIFEYF